MIIAEDDFRITSEDDCGRYWTLELMHVIKPHKKDERKEFKIAGYSMSLQKCLKEIAGYRTIKKYKEDDIVSIKTYIKELRENLKIINQDYLI